MAGAAPQSRAPSPGGALGVLGRLQPPRYSAIWIATALLFAFSPLIASNSLTGSALLSMLPFAALLSIASIGQTLVIQQRGLDLTVPGMILLTTVILTQHAAGIDSRLPVAILLVVVACVASGVFSGVAITQFGIPPFVATLGVNALLIGTVYQLTSGQATATSPSNLTSFAAGKTIGIPNTAVVAVIAIVIIAVLLRTTIVGRRFVAVGANPAAARAAGVSVNTYLIATYVLASLSYGLAGILFSGYFPTPGLSAGSTYLLPTIAAVVLGGTTLAGGTGSVVATAVGAVFLTQLQQILTANGAAESVEFIIQGSIIAASMLLRNVPWRRIWARIAAGATPGDGAGAVEPAAEAGT
ncbi:MAG TPA: ABC transporter permease [Solirubrobacteraceae bacterium]|nr:ABC transporter permease [Solirubrobacteraceae bacterium]